MELIFCAKPLIEVSDWIAIGAVLINGGLAFWIVRTIQNKLANKRVLKDHFIAEIKEVREQYKVQLNNLYSGNCKPKELLPWFKLMNIKVNDLMVLVNQKYDIDKDKLKPYQTDLRIIVTESAEYINNFKQNKAICFSDGSKTNLIQFQQQNNSIFNKLIVNINDFD